MGSMLNKNSMKISRNPEFFVSGLMKHGNKTLGIVNPGFCDQITGKYRYTGRFIKTSLYYLYFPKQVKSLKKNMSINFFIHSHFNIFPVIAKCIGYFHLNFLKNKREDFFLTKTPYLSKAPLRFNLSSQPVFRFQNIAISAVNKLIKSYHENRKIQKHEIRRKDLSANIFFRDSSFFTCQGLNLIYSCADRNIAARESKSMQNPGAWMAMESEKKYISILHPSRRASLGNSYLQNYRNKITIPPVLLNMPVRVDIFANRSSAERQARSDWINHISPAPESDTDILFFSDSLFDSLGGGQKWLKFYEKQSRQRSKRYWYGGMKLVIFPYTGVHNRVKSFVKPGITRLFPAVPPFLQMEFSNKSNVEQRISGFPEKDFSYYPSISRTRHITNTANFFHQTDLHNKVKSFFKSYLTKIPVTIMSKGNDIFNLHNNITRSKQPNISKEKITQPIPLIPFEETAALGADLPSLSAIFSKSSGKSAVMHGNPVLEAKDPDFHTIKRVRNQPVESDARHLNIIKNINLDKKSIKRMGYIPFSDFNFTYGFPDKANKNSMRVIRRPGTMDFPKSLSENQYMMKKRYVFKKSGSVETVNIPSSPGGSISTREPSMAGYRNNFPDMTYFSSNKSPHSHDKPVSAEVKKKTEFFKVAPSYKTDHTKLLSVPGPDLYGLADKVYGLIVERIKRERELRGR